MNGLRVQLKLGLQLVSFFASHLQVEHQILDVQPKLREGFLNQSQNAAATSNGLNDSDVRRFQVLLHRIRQSANFLSQLHELSGHVVFASVRESRFCGHFVEGSLFAGTSFKFRFCTVGYGILKWLAGTDTLLWSYDFQKKLNGVMTNRTIVLEVVLARIATSYRFRHLQQNEVLNAAFPLCNEAATLKHASVS